MLILLPSLAYILLFLIIRNHGLEWRRACLAAATFCGALVVLITEVLSVSRSLTQAYVATAWLFVCAIAALVLAGNRGPKSIPANVPAAKGGALDAATKLLLVGAGGLALTVVALALIAPPNTWDAMEYHLPRVVMWMSNRSVGFYPTPDYCQLIYGPWSEFAMMHTYLLSGGDRFVNMVQALSLIGCAIAASAIAQRLGAGRRGQAIAAVASITIPEGLLEASGPMNTYASALWIAAAVLFLLDWQQDASWINTLCVGLASGLAILTKGTAYIFLPWLVLACFMMASGKMKTTFLARSPALLLLILALNAPHYLRCYSLSGSPLGVPLPEPYPRAQLTMASVTVQGTAANMLRNISLHLGTPSASVNSKIEHVVRQLIQTIGSNADDPNSVWLGMPFEVHGFSLHEIHAGNLLHLVLLSAAIFVVWARWKDRSLNPARWYVAGLAAGFVFFAATIQWQTWGSRYHLPLFVLGAAVIGLALERCAPRQIATLATMALVIYAVPFAVANRTHSLVRWHRVNDVYHPRATLYFSDQHESVAPVYAAIAEYVNQSGCRNVAIDAYLETTQVRLSPPSLYIYPLLALLHADGVHRTVWYTGVENSTEKYSLQVPHPTPCAIICLDCARDQLKRAAYQTSDNPVQVFDQNLVFTTDGARGRPAAAMAAHN